MAEERIEYDDETFEQLIKQCKFKNDLYGIILRIDYSKPVSSMHALSDPSKPVANLCDDDIDKFDDLKFLMSRCYGGRLNLFVLKIYENEPMFLMRIYGGEANPFEPSVELIMEGCAEETRLAFKAAEELILAEGFKVSKDHCSIPRYPVRYTEKGASFFIGGKFGIMINHFELSVARYANHEEQVADIRQKFLNRLEKYGLKVAIPGATEREKFKTDDVAGFLDRHIGNFKIVGGRSRVIEYCDDGGCEVCNTLDIGCSYEFSIRLNKIEDQGNENRYYGTIASICDCCSKIVLKETNLFEDGQKDYDAVFN